MKSLLIVLLVAVATLAACTTIDKALLTPETNEAGEQLYANEAGDTITESERQALPEKEREEFDPVYEGPKDAGDFPDGTVAGVSIGGTLATVAAIWWAIRRRREKPKVAKKKS